MKLRNVGLIAVLAASVLAIIVYAFQRSLVIHNSGYVYGVGVEVYWDSECTNPCTAINWGDLYPGDVKTQQLYIKNIENTPCTLTLATANWSPWSASIYIAVSWNYTGQTLNPGEVLPVTFTLEVSQQITGIHEFQFDIIITATSY